MNFETFWKLCGETLSFTLATEADKKTVEDYKEPIRAVWNDGRQVLLSQIVLVLRKRRNELLKNHVDGQQTTAAVINELGKLMVQISEMQV